MATTTYLKRSYFISDGVNFIHGNILRCLGAGGGGGGINILNSLLLVQIVNYIRSGIHDLWVIRGWGFRPPYWKPLWSVWSKILVTYTYKRSSYPIGLVSSFKTLDLVADQSLAANLTYVEISKSKIYNEKLAANFFGELPKINHGT